MGQEKGVFAPINHCINHNLFTLNVQAGPIDARMMRELKNWIDSTQQTVGCTV